MAAKISQEEKLRLIEDAVTYQSPDEVAKLYKSLGKVNFTARSLGIACRFRGLEWVKALVENGAKFTRDYSKAETVIYYWRTDFALALLDISKTLEKSNSFNEYDQCFTESFQPDTEREKLSVLPSGERLKCAEYLLDNAEKCAMDTDNFLTLCIIGGCEEFLSLCREKGVKFSEEYVEMFTRGSRKLTVAWSDFCEMVLNLNGFGKFRAAIENVRQECGGETLHCTELMMISFIKYLNNVDMLKFILESFNPDKVNKTFMMKHIIDAGAVECLAYVETLGWLKTPKKRDEMIQYAQKEKQTECAAWLMDFKNRTADFAAEREKAEKKVQRELNASPDSLTALKQIWGFTKREDGALCINNYKRSGTVIEVPETLGGKTVTVIGRGAFSPYGPRKTDDIKANMKQITKVILPKTINFIDKEAFISCMELTEVNIPEGVTEISDDAFNCCKKLQSIKIPSSVKKIGIRAFNLCESLKEVVIPEGVVEIGQRAFSQCNGIKSLVIPESVEKIDTEAFCQSNSLERVKLPSKIKEIPSCAFMVCPALKSVEIPDSVQKIGEMAFARCTSLEHIKIPRGVTIIKQDTFILCENLKSIELPDTLEKIRKYSFSGCGSLKRVDIPNSVVQIDMHAFEKCAVLETVVMPSSVKKVEYFDALFEESPNVTVIVEPDSYAEKCCKKYKIPYKYKED